MGGGYMRRRVRASSGSPRLLALASVALIVLALYWARELIVPLLIAVLLAAILLPTVEWLERLKISRVTAATLVWLLAGGVVVSGLGLATRELVGVAQMLPDYQQNIRKKLEGAGFDRAATWLQAVKTVSPVSAAKPEPKPAPPPESSAPPPAEGSKPAEPEPVPVKIVEAPDSTFELAPAVALYTFRQLAIAGFAAIVVLFLLLAWDDVRERFLRLVAGRRVTLTTRAMDEVWRSISTVLRVQLTINLTAGLVIGLGLWALGVPRAPLWGLLAALLRFIPYLGPVMAGAMPVALAVAVSDGWQLPLAIAVVFIVVEVAISNFLEPILLSGRGGVTTVALLVSGAFWTWLWGMPGLLLSTPITVGLAVIGRHVPQLRVFNILLGTTPALAPDVRIYQRLVGDDARDAERLAMVYLDQHGLDALFEEVLIPSLRRAGSERRQGLLDDEAFEDIVEVVQDIVEAAAARADDDRDNRLATADGDRKSAAEGRRRALFGDSTIPSAIVLAVPAGDEADAAGAAMLAASLERAGFAAKALSNLELATDPIGVIRSLEPSAVWVVGIPPQASRASKLRARQIGLALPGLPVLRALLVGTREAADDPTVGITEVPEPASPRSGTRAASLDQAHEHTARAIGVAAPAPLAAPQHGG